MMLFSMLSAAQGGKSIVFLSRHFGLSNRQMTNVIRHYLPILMRGIQKNFAKQGGLSTLLKTLDHGNYASYYEDPNIYTNPTVRNSGLSIMNQALGPEDIQRKIMHRIYLSTGIDPDTLLLVLPYVTTLALSSLYLKAHTSLSPSSMPTGLEYHGNSQPPQQAQQQQRAYAQAAPQQQAPQQPIAQPAMVRRQQQQQAHAQRAAAQQQQTAGQQHPTAGQHLPSPAQQQALQLMRQSHQYQPQQQQPAPQRGAAQRTMHPTQQQAAPQQAPVQTQQHAPVQAQQQPVHAQTQQAPVQPVEPVQAPQQERLPNIILQAQEAHAKKQRKQSKKGRLSRMLKAPFQVTSREQNQGPTTQPPANFNELPDPRQAQPQAYNGVDQGGHHSPAPSYFQQQALYQNQGQQQGTPNLPEHADSSKKYVSLQEKLSAQLPWYEQTG